MKTYDEIAQELDAPIPRSAVSTREGSNGKDLDYLQGHYVIDRLNKIFGPGRWSYSVSEYTKVFEGQIETKYGPTFTVSYIAKVELNVRFPKVITEKTDEHSGFSWGMSSEYISDMGYGDGTDKKNPGKAHEVAIKEAVTDGLKRCAKSLGMSMGLALYSKGQENVTDEEEVKVNAKPAKNAKSAKTEAAKTTVNDKLRETAYVLIAQGKLDKDKFSADIKSKYGVSKTADLKESDAVSLLAELNQVLTAPKQT